jgi:hypothetical protein
MDKTYRYSGPLSAVTLPDDAFPKGRQVRLFPGRDIALPEDNAYVQALVARGHLTPVASPAAPAAPIIPAVTPPAASVVKAESSPSGTASAAQPSPTVASVANTKPTGE